MIIKHDATVNINAAALKSTWCVYEHYLIGSGGSPPRLIYVHTCKLVDVYRLNTARNNSEWNRLTANGNATIMVRIVATCDDYKEAMTHAIQHVRSFNPVPQCNSHGVNMKGLQRRILCSNGQEYASQVEAAQTLGLTQSAISQHLAGKLAHVNGLTFTFAQVT